MESGGGAAGGGGARGGGDGASGGGGGGGHHLCHLCGYQYPNAHPSAKQRRAHRKNCGNPAPSPAAAAVAAVEESDGKMLLQDDGGRAAEGGGGGEGDGASAADSGGVLPGSAQEVGNVVDDDGNAERSSPHVSEVQAVLSKCAEDCVISGDCIPSGNDSKASGTENDEIQTGAVTRLTENVPRVEDGGSAVSSDQYMDGVSCMAPEHEDGARLSSEFSADEINKSSMVSVETDAAPSKISAQRNDIVVAEAEGVFDNIDKGRSNENNENDFSCLEKQKIVEEDSSVNNSSVVSKEQIPCEETVCMEQSRVMFTNSVDHVSNSTKEPVSLVGDKVSIEKHVFPDDTSGDDIFQLARGGSHSEAPGIVKPQQQADSASPTPDELIIPKEMDIDEGLHCPDEDVDIKALSSAVDYADEDITAVNHTKNVCSPYLTAEDDIQDNVRQTSDIILMPSEVDLSEVSTSSTSHEIDKVSSKDGIDERSPNVNLTSHEVNEVHGIDVEEIPQNEDITAYNDFQESNTMCGTRDIEEDTHNKEIIAEASSHKITAVQSTYIVEEKEQIEAFATISACNKINEISIRAIEETKRSDVYVETADKITVASSLETVEEEQTNKETIADLSLEINVANLPSNLESSKLDVEPTTDHTAYEANTVNVTEVEEKKLNEETTIDPTSHINMICSTATDEQKQNEEMSDGPSSDEIIVPHDRFNVEERSEKTMPGPTPDKINGIGTTESVEVTSGTSHEDSAICIRTTDYVEEKDREFTSDSTSYKLNVESNADNVEEKGQTEDNTVDPSSHESDMQRIIDSSAESKKQDTEVAADHAADKIDMPQSTDDAEERKQETVSEVGPSGTGKIDVAQSTDDAEERKQETVSTVDNPNGDDQNEEEIADKEVIVNSDKNHISLKSLLSEKVVETKEKKPSTKDRVLPFRRRASKDGASPVKPGSPKAAAAVSGQQDWNSPARLPVEKKPKGKKQQWVPFICCPSMN